MMLNGCYQLLRVYVSISTHTALKKAEPQTPGLPAGGSTTKIQIPTSFLFLNHGRLCASTPDE